MAETRISRFHTPNLKQFSLLDNTVQQVWDLNRPGKAVHVVQTISSVGRIRWRPGNKTHIATAGSVFDNGIQLWDLKRPYYPLATLLGHKDITAGFLFHHDSPEIVISGGKDSRLLYVAI